MDVPALKVMAPAVPVLEVEPAEPELVVRESEADCEVIEFVLMDVPALMVTDPPLPAIAVEPEPVMPCELERE